MSDPWEDYGSTATATEEGPWSEFEAEPVETPSLGSRLKSTFKEQTKEFFPPMSPMEGLVKPPKVDSENPNFVAAVSGAMGRPPGKQELDTIAALLNSGGSLVEGITSPAGLASLMAGGLGGVASKLISAGWGAYGGSQIAPSIQAIKSARTPQERMEAGLGLGMNVAMPLGAAAHIAGTFAPPTPAELLARQIERAPIEMPESMVQPLVSEQLPVRPPLTSVSGLNLLFEPKPPTLPKPPLPNLPRSTFRPEVPETLPEPERGITVLEEIRAKNARTKEQIKALYPQLTREEAGQLRDRAWGKQSPPEPPSPAAEPVPKEPTPPPKGPATTAQILGRPPLTPEDLAASQAELSAETGETLPPSVPPPTPEGATATPPVAPSGASPASSAEGKHFVVMQGSGDIHIFENEIASETFKISEAEKSGGQAELDERVGKPGETIQDVLNSAKKVVGKGKEFKVVYHEEKPSGSIIEVDQPSPPSPPAEVEKGKGGEQVPKRVNIAGAEFDVVGRNPDGTLKVKSSGSGAWQSGVRDRISTCSGNVSRPTQRPHLVMSNL